MSDLISRRMMLDKMISRKSLFSTNQYEYMALSKVDKARADEIDNCIADLRNAPDAEPERTAKIHDDKIHPVIHYCGKDIVALINPTWNYCPYCGKKLEWI